MTPLHRDCPACDGVGRTRPDWDLCPRCDGVGFVWREGGPAFDCQMALGDRTIGETVTLGNAEIRCRIARVSDTYVWVRILNEGLFGEEESQSLSFFPLDTGVSSVGQVVWSKEDRAGDHQAREDHSDPLQRRKTG